MADHVQGASSAAVGARVLPPMLCIVGRKHVGKTTMVVKLSAELTRRGHRVMTLKHGSHTFNMDPEGTDTYRHFHEGNAERVAMISPDKFALVERWERELSPEEIVAAHLSDADLVLCEGFKASRIPKLEVFRSAAHATPLWPVDAVHADTWRGMVSDVRVAGFTGAHFDIAGRDCVNALATWVEEEFLR